MAEALTEGATQAASPARLEAFLAEAGPKHALWRTLLGVSVIAAVWLVTTVLLVTLATLIAARVAPASLATPASGGLPPPILLAALLGFGGMVLGLWLALRLFHARPLVSVLGPARRVEWRIWFRAAGLLLALNAVAVPLALILFDGTSQSGLWPWIAWVPPIALALFVQTSAEEMVFRGYLLQTLGARFGARWSWMVLPSLLFGLLHFNPGDFGAAAVFIVILTAGLGLIAADITARTGSLSAVMGLHFANNLVAVLVVSLPGTLSGLSLFTLTVDMANPAALAALLSFELAAVLGLYLAYRLWTGRRAG